MKCGPRSRVHGILCGMAVVAAVLSPAVGLEAQEGSPAHAHIGHVLDGFGATPDGEGLLPAARAEAEIAATHARLAAGDPTNLEGMRTHARHVLHAVDPGEADGGPGRGFGVRQAAEGIARHIELAAESEGASDNVRTHAAHVAAAARSVADRAREIVEVVGRIEDAYDYTEAGEHVRRLRTLVEDLETGTDADGDGQASWREGEGGLQHVEQHMQLMARGEGL